jgi:hypothetical protein
MRRWSQLAEPVRDISLRCCHCRFLDALFAALICFHSVLISGCSQVILALHLHFRFPNMNPPSSGRQAFRMQEVSPTTSVRVSKPYSPPPFFQESNSSHYPRPQGVSMGDGYHSTHERTSDLAGMEPNNKAARMMYRNSDSARTEVLRSIGALLPTTNFMKLTKILNWLQASDLSSSSNGMQTRCSRWQFL